MNVRGRCAKPKIPTSIGINNLVWHRRFGKQLRMAIQSNRRMRDRSARLQPIPAGCCSAGFARQRRIELLRDAPRRVIRPGRQVLVDVGRSLMRPWTFDSPDWRYEQALWKPWKSDHGLCRGRSRLSHDRLDAGTMIPARNRLQNNRTIEERSSRRIVYQRLCHKPGQ